MQWVYWVGCTSVLIVLSIQDMKTRSLKWFWLFNLAFINLMYFMNRNISPINLLIVVMVFTVLAVLSRLSKNQIGMGDVWVISLLTLGIGIRLILQIVLLASCGVLLYGVVYKRLKRVRESQSEIPFIPFLTCTYVLSIFITERIGK